MRLCFQYMNIERDGLGDLITYLWWKNWTCTKAWGILLMMSSRWNADTQRVVPILHFVLLSLPVFQ